MADRDYVVVTRIKNPGAFEVVLALTTYPNLKSEGGIIRKARKKGFIGVGDTVRIEWFGLHKGWIHKDYPYKTVVVEIKKPVETKDLADDNIEVVREV